MFLMRKIAHLIVVTVLVVVGIACSPFGRTEEDDDDTRGRGVPDAAIVVQEGREEVSYRPEQRGTIYLYDATTDKLLGEYEVNKGERFTFNPRKRVQVDEKPINVDKVENGNRHRIYFLPADR